MSKKVKNRSQMASFMFLPVLDYFSEISSPKATKSRAVGPFTTNDVFVYRNIHKKGQKRSRNYGPYARLIWSTGRRPVYLRRRCKYFVEEATKSRAVGPFTTNDFFVYRNIHRKRSKKVKNRSQIPFVHVFCPFQTISSPTDRRTVNHERRFVFQKHT